MDIFIAALDKNGPWVITVLLLYLLWQMMGKFDRVIDVLNDSMQAIQKMMVATENWQDKITEQNLRDSVCYETIRQLLATNASGIAVLLDKRDKGQV